jgi:lipopolysaccharide/colanic/teichoic acid biosynthesis glycosyltransferase
VKRILDIALSIMVLAVGVPLWIAIAIAIKITSKGPVLFIQERIGMNGKPFRMLKFRSMVDGADEQLDELIDLSRLPEPVFKIHNDPRTTQLGRLLRRTSLD